MNNGKWIGQQGHAEGGRRGVARRCQERAADHPQPLGRPYKPSASRGYEQDLNNHILDDLGGHKLSDIRRRDVQALIDRLLGVFSWGVEDQEHHRGAAGHLPPRDRARRGGCEPDGEPEAAQGSSPRERAASATEASELIPALPDTIKAIYATAAYAGLRRGELMAASGGSTPTWRTG